MAIIQEGPEPLLWCDQCGMHMPLSRVFKHMQTDKCDKATERRLRGIYVEMAARCGEMEFSLEGGEVYERVEGVAMFWYLGRPLEQTYCDWSAVRRNIMRANLV